MASSSVQTYQKKWSVCFLNTTLSSMENVYPKTFLPFLFQKPLPPSSDLLKCLNLRFSHGQKYWILPRQDWDICMNHRTIACPELEGTHRYGSTLGRQYNIINPWITLKWHSHLCKFLWSNFDREHSPRIKAVLFTEGCSFSPPWRAPSKELTAFPGMFV